MKPKSTRRAKLSKRLKIKFRKSESWKYKRLNSSWRFPNGIDNKIRHQKKGYPPKVRIGYRNPSTIRGLHPSGFEAVIVSSPEEVTLIDRNNQIITISRTIGAKKKLVIVEQAREWAIHITNPGIGPKTIEEDIELEFDEQELADLEGLDDLEDSEGLDDLEDSEGLDDLEDTGDGDTDAEHESE